MDLLGAKIFENFQFLQTNMVILLQFLEKIFFLDEKRAFLRVSITFFQKYHTVSYKSVPKSNTERFTNHYTENL